MAQSLVKFKATSFFCFFVHKKIHNSANSRSWKHFFFSFLWNIQKWPISNYLFIYIYFNCIAKFVNHCKTVQKCKNTTTDDFQLSRKEHRPVYDLILPSCLLGKKG